MANTGNDRYGVRLNTDFQLNDKISGSLDLSGSRKSIIIPVNFGGAIFNIIHDTPPTRRTRFSDGTYGTNLFGRSPLADAKLSGTEPEVFWNGFFFSSRRRHTSLQGDWSSDVCSSD